MGPWAGVNPGALGLHLTWHLLGDVLDVDEVQQQRGKKQPSIPLVDQFKPQAAG